MTDRIVCVTHHGARRTTAHFSIEVHARARIGIRKQSPPWSAVVNRKVLKLLEPTTADIDAENASGRPRR